MVTLVNIYVLYQTNVQSNPPLMSRSLSD